MIIRFKEPMTISEVERYEGGFEDHYVQGTTSIEGNTLTMEQTSDLLRYGLLPGGRALREMNEVQNLRGGDRLQGPITRQRHHGVHQGRPSPGDEEHG